MILVYVIYIIIYYNYITFCTIRLFKNTKQNILLIKINFRQKTI